MALELETENSADGFAAYDCSVKHGSGAVAGVFDPIRELLGGPHPTECQAKCVFGILLSICCQRCSWVFRCFMFAASSNRSPDDIEQKVC